MLNQKPGEDDRILCPTRGLWLASVSAKLSLSPRETLVSFITPIEHFPRPREEDTVEGCQGYHTMVNAFHGDCPRGGISGVHRARSNHDTSLHVWDSFSLCHHLYDSGLRSKVIQGPNWTMFFPWFSSFRSPGHKRAISRVQGWGQPRVLSILCRVREIAENWIQGTMLDLTLNGKTEKILKWHFIFIPSLVMSWEDVCDWIFILFFKKPQLSSVLLIVYLPR